MKKSRIYYFVASVLLITSPAMAGSFKVQNRNFKGRTYLSLQSLATYFGFRYQTPKWGSCRISGRTRQFDFKIKQRFIEADGVKVYLSYAPEIHNSILYVSYLDYQSILDSLMRVKGVSPGRKVRRILIDPGHGGKDSGTRGKKSTEKQVNLQMAKRLKAYLEKAGYAVSLTRWQDNYPSFETRAGAIKRSGADIFLSLHVNATSNKKVSGIETFQLTPKGAASSNGGSVKKVSAPGDHWQRLNARLAYNIHRRLIGATGAKDRGVKNANFKVLRLATAPAVLLELGFLSHPQEEKKLNNATYQDLLARNIAQGVIDYDRSLRK